MIGSHGRKRKDLYRDASGQSLVELALVLPVLILILLGIIQFGVIMNGQITVTNAAREGARAAVVGQPNDTVKELVENYLESSLLIDSDPPYIDPPKEKDRESGGELSVEVQALVPVIVPFPGMDDFEVRSKSVMRVEKLPL